MANDSRKNYPQMPTPHWWALRRKFRAAIPREVSNNYLASSLGMTEKSARTNIMPTLRVTGVVDKDNKPTELAVRWRDDAQYSTVCEEIRENVYPQELRDLAPETSVGRQVIQTWFANHTGLGESGAGKMASFYLMLLEGDASKQAELAQPAAPAAKVTTKGRRAAVVPKPAETSKSQDKPQGSAANQHSETPVRRHPDLNINVQIHISAEAPAEQIDQIFASMAKHLRDFA